MPVEDDGESEQRSVENLSSGCYKERGNTEWEAASKSLRLQGSPEKIAAKPEGGARAEMAWEACLGQEWPDPRLWSCVVGGWELRAESSPGRRLPWCGPWRAAAAGSLLTTPLVTGALEEDLNEQGVWVHSVVYILTWGWSHGCVRSMIMNLVMDKGLEFFLIHILCKYICYASIFTLKMPSKDWSHNSE